MEQSRNDSRSTYLDAGRRGARPLQPQGAVSRRRTYADGELDVFAAERYFKGTMDGGDHRKDQGIMAPAPLELAAAIANYARPRQATVAVARPVGTRASAASVSASSSNSRTMLLRGRRDHRGNKCCVHVGALVLSCTGKWSVRVDTSAANSKEEAHASGDPAVASKIDWYKELRMHKAAHGVVGGDGSNHGVAVVAAAAALPPNLNLGGREEKVAEFTSSSTSRRRSFTFVAPAVNGNQDDDDAGSESSSDLFEIKSLMIDGCPYEPSEASIKWSVATAPADTSERGDRVTGGGSHCGRGPVTGRRSRDRPPTLLSGCVSHRAVEVSTAAATMVPNAPRRR
jgi:hypothetical protein